jgi:medium-chain acyl-[acyl-carrier-protein] hydrolase
VKTTKEPDAWLAYRHPNPEARLRLFCFPYAGGGASIFRTWSNYLPAQVEVCPVQIPGRETRLMETPYKRLTLLIDVLAEALAPFLDKPFVLFGHSMGALISFELVRWLRQHAMPQPIRLLVSGARAPQLSDQEPHLHHLPEKEFVEAILHLNGTPEDVLRHKELMQIILPYLRADFELCETYVYQPEAPLSIPITVFGGWQDKKVKPHELGDWREQTLKACVIHMFSGDHFFLHSCREQMLLNLSHQLKLV